MKLPHFEQYCAGLKYRRYETAIPPHVTRIEPTFGVDVHHASTEAGDERETILLACSTPMHKNAKDDAFPNVVWMRSYKNAVQHMANVITHHVGIIDYLATAKYKIVFENMTIVAYLTNYAPYHCKNAATTSYNKPLKHYHLPIKGVKRKSPFIVTQHVAFREKTPQMPNKRSRIDPPNTYYTPSDSEDEPLPKRLDLCHDRLSFLYSAFQKGPPTCT